MWLEITPPSNFMLIGKMRSKWLMVRGGGDLGSESEGKC